MSLRLKICWILLASVSAGAQSLSTFTSLSIPSTKSTTQANLSSERHLEPTPTGALCANSAFAHGFRHGYDQGFHVGDMDVHMGRDARMVATLKDYHQAGREYRSNFGNRELFEQGYQAGFRSGYTDAVTGSEYRIHVRIGIASDGLGSDLFPPNRREHFDKGVASGYASAQTRNAPQQGMTTEYVEQYCRKTASGIYALEYCSGFARGYLLGIFNAPGVTTQSASSRAEADRQVGNRQ